MKVNQDLSILFWLCKQRKDDSGKAPIYARLTIDGIRTQFSLGKKVLPSQFMQQSGLVKGSSEDAKTLNNYLTLVKGKLQQHYNILITEQEIVTPEMVRNAFSRKTGNVKTLVQAFTWHNDQFEQKVKAGHRASGTLVKFKATLDKVKVFLKHEYHLSDIPVTNIKHSFAEDFEHYLINETFFWGNTGYWQKKFLSKMG